jgi:hypothetical protein
MGPSAIETAVHHDTMIIIVLLLKVAANQQAKDSHR